MVNYIFFLLYFYKNKYSKPSTFEMEQNFQDFFFLFPCLKRDQAETKFSTFDRNETAFSFFLA